nr:cystatin-like protein [Misgurnus anguillicaudatus]
MRGLLWLVGAVLLLGSIDGGDTYEQLDDNVKKIVDQAIIIANEKYGKKHIDFHSIICSDNSNVFNVLLKPTSCAKKAKVHRKECKLQDKLNFWVSCLACDENITCEPVKTQEKINELINNCGSKCQTYLAGKEILFLKQEGKEFGCLGCI